MYISECFGTYLIGFTLICLGVTSGVMSYVYVRLLKFIPRFTVVLFGTCLNICFIIVLLVWEREPNYTVIVVFAVCWGAADAVWHTMTSCKSKEGFRDS